MSGLNPNQLHRLIIRPALQAINYWSLTAERLVLATAIYESGLRELTQREGGPARGLWQFEPATARDIFKNWLSYRREAGERVHDLMTKESLEQQLVSNLSLGAALCRIQYLRSPLPLPDTAQEAGAIYKAAFNSVLGRGSAVDFAVIYENVTEASA